jgi:hypothetical protein
MSTYDESLLAARFAALAPEPLAGSWADVRTRAGAAPESQTQHRRLDALHGRRRVLVVLAAVALVAVVAVSAYGLRAYFADRGYIGIPPNGAVPSTPKSGKLVASFWLKPARTNPNPRRVNAWVYTDGRLIWLRENDPEQPRAPEDASRWSSGLLEQRLTRKGVERIRSQIISTGLFGRTLDLIFPDSGEPCMSFIRVRNRDRLVRVGWTGPQCGRSRGWREATAEETRVVGRLKARLTDPASWLPASAWKQREIVPYVPSLFAVCSLKAQLREPSRVLPLLPAKARDLLRSRDWRRRSIGIYCFDATTEQARSLASGLDAAGPTKKGGAIMLNYQFGPIGSEQGRVVVFFLPYLPNGEIRWPGG